MTDSAQVTHKMRRKRASTFEPLPVSFHYPQNRKRGVLEMITPTISTFLAFTQRLTKMADSKRLHAEEEENEEKEKEWGTERRNIEDT